MYSLPQYFQFLNNIYPTIPNFVFYIFIILTIMCQHPSVLRLCIMILNLYDSSQTLVYNLSNAIRDQLFLLFCSLLIIISSNISKDLVISQDMLFSDLNLEYISSVFRKLSYHFYNQIASFPGFVFYFCIPIKRSHNQPLQYTHFQGQANSLLVFLILHRLRELSMLYYLIFLVHQKSTLKLKSQQLH